MARDERAAKKRQAYLRAVGRPSFVTGPEHEAVIRKIRSFHARGMSYMHMQKQTGVPHRTIAGVVDKPRSGIRRDTWMPLDAMRFEEPEPHVWVDGTGTRRRLRAMWRAGYPLPWLVDRLSIGNRQYFQKVIRGERGNRVQYATLRAVADLYGKLDGVDPADAGVGAREANFARAFASKKGCEPGSCWDEDTIDDPLAPPEWTGRCGTPVGALVHRRDGTPPCPRCSDVAAPLRFSPDGFKKARLSKGLSQGALEKRAGLSKGHVHHWESGRYGPRQAVLDRVLSVLDATLDEVYE